MKITNHLGETLDIVHGDGLATAVHQAMAQKGHVRMGKNGWECYHPRGFEVKELTDRYQDKGRVFDIRHRSTEQKICTVTMDNDELIDLVEQLQGMILCGGGIPGCGGGPDCGSDHK